MRFFQNLGARSSNQNLENPQQQIKRHSYLTIMAATLAFQGNQTCDPEAY